MLRDLRALRADIFWEESATKRHLAGRGMAALLMRKLLPPYTMTQSQREALLDLVILALFADSHISLKEDAALQAALEKVGWEAVKPREIFFLNSMSRARQVSESASATSAYLTERAQVLKGGWSSAETVCFIASILASDGVTPEETAFLGEVKAALA